MNTAKSSPTLILPERQNGGRRMLAAGYICRCALALLCVYGFSLFLCDALSLGLPAQFQFIVCFIITLWFSIMGINRFFFVGGGIAGAGAITVLVLQASNPLVLGMYCVMSLINAYYRKLISLGYKGLNSKVMNFDYTLKRMRMTESECRQIAYIAIVLVLAALICACLLRKTHIYPLLLVGCSLCTVALYFGLATGNIGFAVVIASLCGVMALSGYDNIYARRKTIANRLSLNGSSASERAELRNTVRANSALGGFTGLTAALLALALLIIPAGVDQSMSDIPAISVPALKVENYLVALANGQNPDFQSLIFSGIASIDSRSTESSDRVYSGQKVFEVLTDTAVPVYMRNWVGLDYYEDSWHSASYDRIAEYKRIFGEGFSPELLTFELLNIMDPSLVTLPEKSGYKAHTELGYVTMQVNIRKLTPSANLVFLPSYTDQKQRLLEFATREQLDTGYSNYYDGIFTGSSYMFLDDYSVIANVQLLRDSSFAENLGKLVGEFLTESSYIEFIRAIAQDGGSQQMLEKTYESMRSSSRSENSLADRYVYEMTEEERASVHAIIDNLALYQEYVYQNYLTGCEDFERITRLAQKIVSQTSAASGSYVDNNGMLYIAPSSNVSLYAERHQKVMAIIDYLSENMTYTLTPEEPSARTEYYNAVSTFLFDTKEGYCVQFASAACMMLRSLGIPARYAEGYITNQYNRLSSKNAVSRYSSTIRDNNAHAWIEVYYDSYGWVQYEATAPYYSEMYEGYQVSVTDTTEYISYEETTYPEETTDIEPIVTPDPIDDDDSPVNPAVVIIAVSAALLVVLTICILKRRAIRWEKRHAAMLADVSNNSLDADGRLNLAARLDDSILHLLAYKKLIPSGGEQYRQFAARVDDTLGGFSKYSFTRVSQAMLAGEFGRDISQDELRVLASYLDDLTHYVQRDAGYFERLWLKYFYLPS
ncbi:MAG: transglutaminase domain-containing protein [Clostridia bacterium]|nr:transglutaminase domain-containing protein [Clostridia bacterium]